MSQAVRDPLAWRDAAASGRYLEAERLRTLAVGEGADTDDELERSALRAVSAVQASLRSKAWKSAERRASEPLDLPPGATWLQADRVGPDVAILAAAGAALERRDVDAATSALSALDALPPGPFEAERLTQRGTAYVLDGRDQEAREAFEAALSVDPRHPRALVNLGNVALEAGEVDAAIEHYRAALDVDEHFANAHHNLGVAYRRKGMIGKSVASLRRAQRAERRHDTREARAEVRGLAERGAGRWIRRGLWALAIVVALIWWTSR